MMRFSRSNPVTPILAGVAALTATMLATRPAQASETTAPTSTDVHYTIKDLGTLGGTDSNAQATDGHTVVGAASTPSRAFHAFAYNLATGTMARRTSTDRLGRRPRPTLLALSGVIALIAALIWIGATPAAADQGPHLMLPAPQTGTSPATTPTNLDDHGGPVQSAPRVYVDFWGFSTDPSGEAAYLARFLSGIGNTAWLATVNQYGGGSQANLLAGTWFDNAPVPANPTDAQIQQEALTTAAHLGTGNSVNVQIVVATPTGHSTPGFGTQFCAYHGALAADPSVTYTNLPYMTDAGTACGEDIVNGANGLLDGVSIVEGHELAEAITDPLLNAWYDFYGQEIGDKCAWNGHLADIPTHAGTFPVQPLWSNNAGACVLPSTPPAAPQWTPWRNDFGAPPAGVAAGSAPTVASWSAQRLDVFVRGGDNGLWQVDWAGTSWSTWQSIDATAIASSPAAVSWGPNRIDIVAYGPDGNVWHKAWNGTSFTGWEKTLGHPPPGLAPGASVAISSRGVGSLDVLAAGTDGSIWHSLWTGTQWSAWESVGPSLANISGPAAVSMNSGRIDLFAIGPYGRMWHTEWINGWGGWDLNLGQPAPGSVGSAAPAVSSWGTNRLDVFARGTDNAVYQATWTGGNGFGPWQSRGQTIVSSPAAVSWSPNRIDLFGIGPDHNVWHQIYN
jgi:hypothetical protein